MVSLYFEDSHVSPGMVNLGVRKALWPLVQKMNEVLRLYESCTGAHLCGGYAGVNVYVFVCVCVCVCVSVS